MIAVADNCFGRMSRLLLPIGQLDHDKTKVLYDEMMMCWIVNHQLTFIGYNIELLVTVMYTTNSPDVKVYL